MNNFQEIVLWWHDRVSDPNSRYESLLRDYVI